MPNDAATTNALLVQKDRIIRFMNDGEFAQAFTLLEFVRPLWMALFYEYKARELLDAMQARLQARAFGELGNEDDAATLERVKLAKMVRI